MGRSFWSSSFLVWALLLPFSCYAQDSQALEPISNESVSTDQSSDNTDGSKTPKDADDELDEQIREDRPGIWLELDIGIIGSASDEILRSAFESVKKNNYKGLLIKLDTPGGALDATRSMVKNILAASIPVVVWVGPNGARAASAGAFLTMSAHVAAMAQGTNIGAATPIQAGGQGISDEDVKRKVENDTVAFMESIADVRGRNKEMAVSFVVNALSVTANEALENNIIDLLADTPTELINSLDGRIIDMGSYRLELNTLDDDRVVYEKNLREMFLEILSNPNLFYLLFIAGIIGIGVELTNPGVLIPGVLGGLSLIVALIATSVIPINFGAMALIVVSIAFMIAEVFLPSFGILGIGGFIGFLMGSVLLIDSEGLAISWFTIGPVAIGVIAFALLVFYLVYRVEHSKVLSGKEALIGRKVKASGDFSNGKGRVFVDGEYWSANESNQAFISDGEQLEVVEVNGLNLVVKKLNS